MNHTLIKLAILAGIVIGGLLLYAFFVPSPTIAAECSTYDVELGRIKSEGATTFEIPPDKLPKVVQDTEDITGDDYGAVSRGFLVFLPDVLMIGLEANGCLYTPILIARPKPDAAA